MFCDCMFCDLNKCQYLYIYNAKIQNIRIECSYSRIIYLPGFSSNGGLP